MSVTTIDGLPEAISLELTRTQQQLLLAFRGVANEAGLPAARAGMFDALDGIDRAQQAVRQAQDAERSAKADAADAALDAEWEIRDRRVEKIGSKTFWITDDDEVESVLIEGTEFAEQKPTGRKVRIQVTADEARERLAAEVRRHPAVQAAEAAAREAEEATAAARDRLALADRRFSATKADTNAAAAQLQALAMTLPVVLAQETHR